MSSSQLLTMETIPYILQIVNPCAKVEGKYLVKGVIFCFSGVNSQEKVTKSVYHNSGYPYFPLCRPFFPYIAKFRQYSPYILCAKCLITAKNLQRVYITFYAQKPKMLCFGCIFQKRLDFFNFFVIILLQSDFGLYFFVTLL